MSIPLPHDPLIGRILRLESLTRDHPPALRDTVWYSIIDRDWPEVKSLLDARLPATA